MPIEVAPFVLIIIVVVIAFFAIAPNIVWYAIIGKDWNEYPVAIDFVRSIVFFIAVVIISVIILAKWEEKKRKKTPLEILQKGFGLKVTAPKDDWDDDN